MSRIFYRGKVQTLTERTNLFIVVVVVVVVFFFFFVFFFLAANYFSTKLTPIFTRGSKSDVVDF